LVPGCHVLRLSVHFLAQPAVHGLELGVVPGERRDSVGDLEQRLTQAIALALVAPKLAGVLRDRAREDLGVAQGVTDAMRRAGIFEVARVADQRPTGTGALADEAAVPTEGAVRFDL